MSLLILLLLGSFTQHDFESAAGARKYWLYVPSSYDGTKPVPLVVMLHGCTQDANDLARGTRLNEYAERQGFIVAYPEQPPAHNPIKCWNWFDTRHQARDAGEPAIIAGITRQVLAGHSIDSTRVFLGGISAGAAMANIVAITYPEIFTALALHSGLEFRAATSVLDARKAMLEGGPDPVTQGELAYRVMGERARAMRVIIFNGALDRSVPPLHAAQLELQWRTIAKLAGAPATVETIIYPDVGHAWSGGSEAGTYTDPKGPNATAAMVDFFLERLEK